MLVATLDDGRHRGRGEAAGVFFRGETALSMAEQIEAIRGEVETGVSREALRSLLPAGGARNALDCALWDLESHRQGAPIWRLAGLAPPRPLRTTFTVGADTPAMMAARAEAFGHASAIKLKLLGDGDDAARVREVRRARPDVWLGVDGNQGFTTAALSALMPTLVSARVALIEQPFRFGEEALIETLASPIPLAADESASVTQDLARIAGRFEVVNIKLDKAGGLTEALRMARTARRLGLEVMVGNMGGTSLAMAPALLVGQLARVVDIDGPIFLSADRPGGVTYRDGFVSAPDSLWGVAG